MPEETKEETSGGEKVEPKVEAPAVDPAMANPVPPAEAVTSEVADSSNPTKPQPPLQTGTTEPARPVETQPAPAAPVPAAPEKKSSCGCWIVGIVIALILLFVVFFVLPFVGVIGNPLIGIMSLFG